MSGFRRDMFPLVLMVTAIAGSVLHGQIPSDTNEYVNDTPPQCPADGFGSSDPTGPSAPNQRAISWRPGPGLGIRNGTPDIRKVYRTQAPIILKDGAVFESATDISFSTPFGTWAQARSYRSSFVNIGSPATYGDADSVLSDLWFSSENDRSYWNGTDPDVILSADSYRSMTGGNGPADSYLYSSTGSGTITIKNGLDNEEWQFDTTTGQLLKHHTKGGGTSYANQIEYGYFTASNAPETELIGLLAYVLMPGATHAAYYDYTLGLNDAPRVSSVSLKEISTQTVIKKVEYTYRHQDDGQYYEYDDDTSSIDRDQLIQVKVMELATGSTADYITRTTQYRYHANSARIKAIYEPDALQRIMDFSGGAITEPEVILQMHDNQEIVSGSYKVQDFASRLFEYYTSPVSTSAAPTAWDTSEDLHMYVDGGESEVTEQDYMIKSETIRSGGPGGCCGGGGSGSVRLDYYHIAIANSGGVNEPARMIVEDSVDSTNSPMYRRLYVLNSFGHLIREVLIDNPTSGSAKYWCQAWIMATSSDTAKYQGRVKEYRAPSAYDVTSKGDVSTLIDDPSAASIKVAGDGFVEVYSYNSTGDRKETAVAKGIGTTATPVSAALYGADFFESDPFRKRLVRIEKDYITSSTTAQTTYTITYWSNGNLKTRVRSLPVISTSQNGTGAAATVEEYFDDRGRLRWAKDGEGAVTYYSYHPVHGQLAYIVQDADPGSLPASASSNSTKWDTPTVGQASSNKPTRGTGLQPSTPLSLVTYYEFDNVGRRHKTVDPGGDSHYTVYKANQVLQFKFWQGTSTPVPISVTDIDNGGQVTASYTVRPGKATYSGSVPTGISTLGTGDFASLTKFFYLPTSGQKSHVDTFAKIPSNWTSATPSNRGTDYYRTEYTYDAAGRVETIAQDKTSTYAEITKQLYDTLGRSIGTQKRVEPSATFRDVSGTVYDGGGVGDGHITQVKRWHGTGANDYTGTNFAFDWRGFRRAVIPFKRSGSTDVGLSPTQVTDYDYRGLPIAAATYGAALSGSTVAADDDYAQSLATNRKTLNLTFYDNLRRVYRTEERTLNSSGVDQNKSLQVNQYYNQRSDLIAQGETNGAGTEYAYDAAGRQYQTRVVRDLKFASGVVVYRNPQPNTTVKSMTGGDDYMLQFNHSAFDNSGNVTEQHDVEMVHKDTNGLNMGSNGFIRRSVYSWYDTANRIETVGDYGSGDGASNWAYEAFPTSPPTKPTTSSTLVLVKKFSYNSDTGRLEKVTDPKGTDGATFYDLLGRTQYQVSNFDDFEPSTENNVGGSDRSEDQVVKMTYDGLDNLLTLRAMNYTGSSTVNQDTVYTYGDAVHGSLATKVVYPRNSSDDVDTTFNIDGTVNVVTDQRGVTLTHYYNDWRGLEWQAANSVSGVDGTVIAVKREYDVQRRLQAVTSYGSFDALNKTGSTPRNQIFYEYLDGTNRLKKVRTDHNGASAILSAGTEYRYDETWDTTTNLYLNGRRVAGLTYPSGRKVDFSYGTTNSFDDRLHRLSGMTSNLKAGGTLTNLSTYGFNGVNRLVSTNTYYNGSSTVKSNYDLSTSSTTDGTYELLDRFGRIRTKDWRVSSTVKDSHTYAYDYASNPISRDESVSSGGFDQAFGYDGAHRLISADKGTYSGSSLGSINLTEDWTLDGLGNWSNFTATGSLSLNQNRAHNNANEITSIASSATHVAHDGAGNMTKVPVPGSWSSHYDLVYDAWNRLVQVKLGGSTVATYQYDGLNQRIVKTASGVTDYFHYNMSWQVMEVTRGSETGTAVERCVWHPYYIDALAARYSDTNTSNGHNDANEVHFALHDANMNVTALVNESGTVFERYAYSPYGRQTVLNGSFGTISSSSVGNSYTFTGRRFDAETGLYQYRLRYFHNGLGRFVNRDPLRYVDGPNTYQYVGGSPVFGMDAFGLCINNGAAECFDGCEAECRRLYQDSGFWRRSLLKYLVCRHECARMCKKLNDCDPGPPLIVTGIAEEVGLVRPLRQPRCQEARVAPFVTPLTRPHPITVLPSTPKPAPAPASSPGLGPARAGGVVVVVIIGDILLRPDNAPKRVSGGNNPPPLPPLPPQDEDDEQTCYCCGINVGSALDSDYPNPKLFDCGWTSVEACYGDGKICVPPGFDDGDSIPKRSDLPDDWPFPF